jgi:hypothetical protein
MQKNKKGCSEMNFLQPGFSQALKGVIDGECRWNDENNIHSIGGGCPHEKT